MIHVDDSPDVLGEFQQFIVEKGSACQWRVVGIAIKHCKDKVQGVPYCLNVREALQ